MGGSGGGVCTINVALFPCKPTPTETVYVDASLRLSNLEQNNAKITISTHFCLKWNLPLLGKDGFLRLSESL